LNKIGIVAKSGSAQAAAMANRLSVWLSERGAAVYADAGIKGLSAPALPIAPDELPGLVDAVVVLGGDGTMLSAARLMGGRKVPILGVNLGGLGFLTAATVKEMYPLLERLLKDEAGIEERMALSVELKRADGSVSRYSVLNDVVIRGGSSRLVRVETRINREYVTTYRADGLIVATPTGSTAYSLSAAGPILYPTIHSIIVAPICPFNLTNRPVVIPDWMTVEVKASPGQSNILLVLDGQVDVPIECADVVVITRADFSVYLVKNEAKSYFDILRERLMWEVKA
jgi:NAD+ kinase